MRDNKQQLALSLKAVSWSTMQIIDGSRVLTSSEKRLISKIYGFSKQGRGCFASMDTLADRLGMSVRTLQAIRTKLRRIGLLTSIPSKRPNQPHVWCITLTPDCNPGTGRLDLDMFQRFRERLDTWLAFRLKQLETGDVADITNLEHPAYVPARTREYAAPRMRAYASPRSPISEDGTEVGNRVSPGQIRKPSSSPQTSGRRRKRGDGGLQSIDAIFREMDA